MKILAFDTSTAQGSVAVAEGEQILTERSWRREKSHSEFLTSEIEEAMREAGVAFPQLGAIAVGQGPGSFTGIRVAINAARSLAYALKIPVYVFETTELLSAQTDKSLVAILNAQKNLFFVSEFPRTGPIRTATVQDLENVLTTPKLCVGDGCELAMQAVGPESKLNLIRDSNLSDYPLARDLVKLAHQRGQPIGWNAVQPLYIRASGAEETLKGS